MKVGVGITCLDERAELERLLKSIDEWTWHKNRCEWIVLDDTGDEGDNELTGGLVAKYPFARFECNDRNLGSLAAGWNKLTRLLDADMTVLLSVDVVAYAYWLDAVVQALMDNPHAGMMGYWMPMPLSPRHWFKEKISTKILGQGSHSSGCCFAFTRQVYKEVGGFDEDYVFGWEEVDFGLRCIRSGYVNYMVAVAGYPVDTFPLMFHGRVPNATPSKYFHKAAKHQASLTSKEVFTEKWGSPYSGDLCQQIWAKATFKEKFNNVKGATLTAPPKPW